MQAKHVHKLRQQFKVLYTTCDFCIYTYVLYYTYDFGRYTYVFMRVTMADVLPGEYFNGVNCIPSVILESELTVVVRK